MEISKWVFQWVFMDNGARDKCVQSIKSDDFSEDLNPSCCAISQGYFILAGVNAKLVYGQAAFETRSLTFAEDDIYPYNNTCRPGIRLYIPRVHISYPVSLCFVCFVCF